MRVCVCVVSQFVYTPGALDACNPDALYSWMFLSTWLFVVVCVNPMWRKNGTFESDTGDNLINNATSP